MNEAIKELLQFLQIGARLDLKAIAVEHVLGFTGSKEGVTALTETPQLLVSLISLLSDKTIPISKDASLCLVNISADEKGAGALMNLNVEQDCPPLQRSPGHIVKELLNHIFDPQSYIADHCCMILSNLSRPSHLIEKVVDVVEETERTFERLIDAFTKTRHNRHGATLHYLGPVLSNLSQSRRVRDRLLDPAGLLIQRLLPFTAYADSLVRRGGVAGAIRNCCFDEERHEWLLGEDVDVLPRLLLPLAGGEEFDDEDNDGLPPELQYLPEDKAREEDPDIRCILLEAITQLVAKKPNREFIRNKNTYLILRELHKWEKDKKALSACENLVDILIRTEDEIDAENLKKLEIPLELQDNFKKMDEELVNSN